MYRKTWLLVDANYLCYRAYHSITKLTHEGEATGVLYGVMKTVQALGDLLATDYVAFCFDGENGYRKTIYPAYKANRERDENYEMFAEQVNRLPGHLIAAGFPNVHRVTGFEADDLMAHFAAELADDDEGVLVTEDQDMYQCLRPNVWMHKPRKGKAYTLESFEAEYGITVDRWAMVKAIAGCSSDNITGVAGVGEKKAIQFLTKTMNKETKTYKNIIANKELAKNNYTIVRLPLDGTKATLDQTPHTPRNWKKLSDTLGMNSLAPKNKEGGFGLG